MYRFYSYSYGWLMTAYSPREISRYCCFDASNEDTGDSIVIASDDVDFRSFEYMLF